MFRPLAAVAVATALSLPVTPLTAGEPWIPGTTPTPLPLVDTTPPATKRVFFNDPDADSGALTNAIVATINAAGRAATIHVAIYFALDDGTEAEKIVDALRAAVGRGARVKVVMDSHFPQWDATSLHDEIAAIEPTPVGPTRRVEVVQCDNGCFGKDNSNSPANDFEGYDKMHNKFVVIDDMVWTTTTRENLVLQTSANWSDKQLKTHYHNDALVIWDDDLLYHAYRNY